MGADRVVQGNLSANGTNAFDQQALIQDVANNVLSISGTSKKISTLHSNMFGIGAQTALTAITTAQNLFTLPFAAGFLNLVGRRIKVRFTLIYSTTVGNVATISFALKLGSVTLCTITTPATNTAASANLPIQVEFELVVASLGASGTIESHGIVFANIGTAAAAIAGVYLDTNVAVSGAVNLITAETLAVTIAASAAVPSAQVREASIQIAA